MSLAVMRAVGLVTVQDLGRPGRMHEALARGGALVRSALVAANRAAGAPEGAAALEVLGQLAVRAEADCVVGLASAAGVWARLLRAGEELALASEPARAAYLALRGGVDAPIVLGSRSVHVTAGLGRRLRAGDRVSAVAALSDPRGASGPLQPPPALRRPRSVLSDAAAARDAAVVSVVPGPDADALAPDALARLCAAPYVVLPTSDRLGTRLAGPALPRLPAYPERSRPMALGALEVPRDGQPIVLGPEHPTTGGYPLVAVVAHASLDLFFAVRLGGAVRFTLA